MRFRFIHEHRGRFEVSRMCRVLRVSRSGYYSWHVRPESPRSLENRRLLGRIREAHEGSRGTYGSPRVHAELRAYGERCGRNRIARLMRLNGIQARSRRKFRATTDSKHNHPVAENRLNREFSVPAPDRVWVGDITYAWTREGWLYLAVVIDLFSRLVVGWSMGDRITRNLTMGALRMALWRRKPKTGLLAHHDQGSQYACSDYRRLLKAHGVELSMSRKGDCWDNAVAESFFGTLKTELVHDRDYWTRSEAKGDIFEWIESFYNRRRRHSTLGYLSPAEFERTAHAA